LLRLPLGRPDGLDETVALSQAVQGVVGLAHGADEAAQGVDVVLALDGTAVLVDLGDGDLNGGVVLGLDDAVGRRALPRDVAAKKNALSVLPYCVCLGRAIVRITAAPERRGVARSRDSGGRRGGRTGRQSRRGRSPLLRYGIGIWWWTG
jgi:hypothetical protein